MNPLWAVVLVLAGAAQAAALAWPLPGLPLGEPVAWLQGASLVVLVWGLRRAPSARAAFLRGWLFALAWLAGTFWWLYISMHLYGGMPAPLAALAVLALAALLGLYYAVAGALFWCWRGAVAWVQALAFSALWTLAELARGTWFTGFPWGAGGYALVDAYGWLAPYVGVYGMGALSAALAAWVGAAQTLRPTPALAVAVMLALPLAWSPAGRWLQQTLPGYTLDSGTMPVTLLQGNIAQDEKFLGGSGVPQALRWYDAQIRLALVPEGGPPSLVVAPETAIPLLPQDMDPAYWNGLVAAVRGSATAVLIGLPLGNWTEGYTNSVAGWSASDPDMYRYDKHHLVPFGEFIPPFFRWFTDLMDIPLGDFHRGALQQAPLAWAGQRIAPNICYEDLFGEELAAAFRDPAAAPTVLVNLSNIAWFGDTVAIDQHRHISRLRALELERPMLRATNTGATAVIDHRGRVTHELPRLTRGALRSEVQGRDGRTPYAMWAGWGGLWPLAVLCLVVLAGVWRGRRGPQASRWFGARP